LNSISLHFTNKPLKLYGRNLQNKSAYVKVKSKSDPQKLVINDYAIFTDKKGEKYIQYGYVGAEGPEGPKACKAPLSKQ
jgi:hypothetical protein